MKQKLLLLCVALCAVFSTNAQTISVLGDFSSWQDQNMMTDDNVEYYLEGVVIPANGNAKFRQDGAWTINWGSNTFPTGTGTQNGPDIPVLAGIYDISINIVSGAYAFEAVVTDFDNIGFIGGFNWFSESVPMLTTDGDVYTYKDFYFNDSSVKFRKDNAWNDNWGGTTFPSGDAIYDAPTYIPLTTGFYNITFDLDELTYDFQPAPITMIGPAVSDWNTDVAMTTADGGKTFTAEDVALSAGEMKFRVNNAWSLNYGGTTFPNGTANPNSVNEAAIVAVAGTYDITFDRVALTYTFTSTLSNPENEFSNVKIYPNPTFNQWNVSLGNAAATSLQLSDISGKVIVSMNNILSDVSIDASALQQGVYFATLRGENGQKTFKLVKN
ncbi:MAG: T9SS type A sorting domain-containing protein [Flavobacterium sp.]